MSWFSFLLFFCPTDFTDFHRFFMESLMNRFVQSQGDICNDRTGRLREIPCRPMMKKICVICEICVTKKTSQEKSVYICEICGTKFSSDFTDESEDSIAYRITHGFARIFGRWPMARARYVLLLFLVTQISQIYTDFSSWDYFCPTDFTDLHRFFMESLVKRFIRSQGVSATTEQVASAKFRE